MLVERLVVSEHWSAGFRQPLLHNHKSNHKVITLFQTNEYLPGRRSNLSPWCFWDRGSVLFSICCLKQERDILKPTSGGRSEITLVCRVSRYFPPPIAGVGREFVPLGAGVVAHADPLLNDLDDVGTETAQVPAAALRHAEGGARENPGQRDQGEQRSARARERELCDSVGTHAHACVHSRSEMTI